MISRRRRRAIQSRRHGQHDHKVFEGCVALLEGMIRFGACEIGKEERYPMEGTVLLKVFMA